MESMDSTSLSDLKLVGSRDEPYGAWAQKLAVNGKIYLDIDDELFAEERSGGAVSALIRIVYFDSSEGSWRLKYDAADKPNKVAATIVNRNSKEWKTIEIPVEDGWFANRCLVKADIVIENIDAEECVFHLIEVERGKR
jgi:hypothetical protein